MVSPHKFPIPVCIFLTFFCFTFRSRVRVVRCAYRSGLGTKRSLGTCVRRKACLSSTGRYTLKSPGAHGGAETKGYRMPTWGRYSLSVTSYASLGACCTDRAVKYVGGYGRVVQISPQTTSLCCCCCTAGCCDVASGYLSHKSLDYAERQTEAAECTKIRAHESVPPCVVCRVV